MAYQIQVRSDIASNWAGRNPILAQGEPGYETDTGKLKYGNGTTPWNALPYFAGNSATVSGPNSSIQFNNSGNLSGSANLLFNAATRTLAVAGNITAGNFIGSGSYLDLSNVTSNIIPASNNLSLGTLTRPWKEMFVSANTIYINGVPLSVGTNVDLTFNGAPIVTTNPDPNVTTVIQGGFNISGEMSSNTVTATTAVTAPSVVANVIQTANVVADNITGNGAQVFDVHYANLIGAYGNSNVAAFLPDYTGIVQGGLVTSTGNMVAVGNIAGSYIIGNGAFLTGLPTLDNYSNANVAAFLPTYTGVVHANTVSTSGNVTGQYLIGNGAFLTGLPTLDNYSNANVAAYLPTDPTILAIESNIATLTTDVATLQGNVATIDSSIAALSNSVANLEGSTYSNANVAAYLPSDPTIITLQGNVANLAANSYSNANVAAYLATYSGNVSSDVVSANTLLVGDANTPGSFFIDSTANSLILGQSAAQTISMDGNGIFIAGTGGVTLQGAAGAGITLGGGTTGSITVLNPIDLGPASNVHISGGGAGQILATDGNSNLYWTNDTTTYGNANVADYLPVYGGNISVDVVSATGNVDAGLNYFIGNGAFLTGLDAATGYSNANVQGLLPVYAGNILANVVTANTLTSNGNAVASSFVTPNNRVGTPRANGSTDKVTLFTIPGNWNYAMGVDSTRMWFSVGASGEGFSWYEGGNLVMQSTGPDLWIEGGISADTFTASSVMSTATITTDDLIANTVLTVDVSATTVSASGNVVGNTVVANVGNIISLNTSNVSVSGTVTANGVVANTANITSITANTIVANSVTTAYDMVSVQTTANTIILGNATTAVNQIAWATSNTSSMANATLFSISASNISSIDFGITATSGNNRQVSKILAVTLGSDYNYTEYGSLSIGSLLGNFFVDLVGGNLVLQVQPFTANAVYYSIIMDYDFDLHLGTPAPGFGIGIGVPIIGPGFGGESASF